MACLLDCFVCLVLGATQENDPMFLMMGPCCNTMLFSGSRAILRRCQRNGQDQRVSPPGGCSDTCASISQASNSGGNGVDLLGSVEIWSMCTLRSQGWDRASIEPIRAVSSQYMLSKYILIMIASIVSDKCSKTKGKKKQVTGVGVLTILNY